MYMLFDVFVHHVMHQCLMSLHQTQDLEMVPDCIVHQSLGQHDSRIERICGVGCGPGGRGRVESEADETFEAWDERGWEGGVDERTKFGSEGDIEDGAEFKRGTPGIVPHCECDDHIGDGDGQDGICLKLGGLRLRSVMFMSRTESDNIVAYRVVSEKVIDCVCDEMLLPLYIICHMILSSDLKMQHVGPRLT
jgi:hypothetical protein